MFIYKILNKINGKYYIGKAKNPIERFKSHIRGAEKGKDFLIHRAIRKYGKENFELEIIEEVLNENVNEKEIFYIKQYNSYFKEKNSNGYNMTPGGEGGDTLSNHPNKIEIYKKCSETFRKNESGWTNKHLPEEMKQRISYTLKNNDYVVSEETRKKLSIAGKNKKFSKETLEKLRINNLGEKNPMYGKASWCRGLSKETDERIANAAKKISKTKKEKFKSGELVAWNKGKKLGPMSDEEKEKRCKILYIIIHLDGKIEKTRLIKKWLKENNLNMTQAMKLYKIIKEPIK